MCVYVLHQRSEDDVSEVDETGDEEEETGDEEEGTLRKYDEEERLEFLKFL